MKRMHKARLPLLSFLQYLLYGSLPIIAQSNSTASSDARTKWSSSPFENKVFIENKGQFDATLTNREPSMESKMRNQKSNIFYYACSGGVDIYFSPNRLIYRHDEYISRFNEKEIEEIDINNKGSNEKALETKCNFLEIEWIDANPYSFLESSEIQSFYYTYPGKEGDYKTTIRANCFKKIICKNLYPNIDIEYILPEKGGVKYSLIIHPGADISLIKMHYKNSNKIQSDRNGNIIIQSDLGDFIDHAPISFYENGINIPSTFKVNEKNIVSFALSKTGTKSQTIVIDPWIQNPLFPVNKAYDVNYDLAGNVYVCGSGSSTQPYQLAKFNTAGTLQWTYSTHLGLQPGRTIYGDFAVDETNGISYLFGVQSTGSVAIKVNTFGFQTKGVYNPPFFPTGLEFWRAEFNPCLNKIILGCGGVAAPYQIALLDTSLTTATPFNVLAATNCCHDVALFTIDPNNSFCYIAVSESGPHPTQLNNVMAKLPVPNFLPLTWGPVNNGYSFGELTSIAYTPFMLLSFYSNGFNGMACGPTYLYTYDGNALKKWDKNTGAFIAQVTTGGTMFATGGLSADKCDNVYAGVGNVIKAYNSSLVQIATYPVANTCYDLKLGPNNKLYACGAAFVEQIDVPALSQPTATSTPATGGCNSCNGTATVFPCGDPSGFTYLWSAAGQTGQTATGLCPGTYTVSITYACTDINVVAVSVLGGTGAIALSSTQTNACANAATITINASGGASPYTYLWSNGQTTSILTGLSAGSYTITATDANGCSTFKVITITNNIIVSYSTNSGCARGSADSITLNVTGGNPGYSYAWSNGQTAAIATGLVAGTYTVTVTDASGCIQTKVITLPVFAPLTIQTDHTTACTTTAQATVVSVNGGSSPYIYNWSSTQIGPTATGLTAGTYSVTVSDANGCSTTKSVTITNGPNPVSATFTQSPFGTICKGTTVNFYNTGSTGSYNWVISPITPANVSGTTVNFSYTFLTVGTYTVNHTVSYPSGGCSATQSTTIAVINCTGPVVTAMGSSVCPGTCAIVTSSASNGHPPYTYLWSTSATSATINPCPVSATNYTVTITDNTGLTASSVASVTENQSVSVYVTTINIACNGGTNGSATATGNSGSPPFTYNWSAGIPGSGFQVSGLSAGNYTVTVTDSKGCSATSIVVINSPAPLIGQFTKGTANCTACGCKEWLMITATGGTSPYSYSWPDGYVNRYKNQLCPGNYNINIKDKNGCSVNVNLSTP